MTTSTDGQYLLPPEDLSSVLSSIELLSAMWSGTDELSLPPGSEESIRLLADYLSLPLEELGSEKAKKVKEGLVEEVVIGLKVRPNPEEQGEGVWVNVRFPLRKDEGKEDGEGAGMWVSAKDAPPWLTRENVDEVNRILSTPAEEEEEDTVGRILGAIERVSEFLLPLSSTSTTTTLPPPPQSASRSPSKWVRRTWFYLPSLSTPSKRCDIVTLATSLHITGFLLAGKPGLIVLEYPLSSPTPPSDEVTLAVRAMDAFWSEIKTTSWSDIPPGHKKISEKLIEPSIPRAFEDFQDITDNPETERGSGRGRKSDLSKLIKWLDAKGVKGKWCLEHVLGVGGWET